MLLLHEQRILAASGLAEVDLQQLVASRTAHGEDVRERAAEEPRSTRVGVVRVVLDGEPERRRKVRIDLDPDHFGLDAPERGLKHGPVEAVDVDLQQDGPRGTALPAEDVDDVVRRQLQVQQVPHLGLRQVRVEPREVSGVDRQSRMSAPVQLVAGVLDLAVAAAEVDDVRIRARKRRRDRLHHLRRRARAGHRVAPAAGVGELAGSVQRSQQVQQLVPRQARSADPPRPCARALRLRRRACPTGAGGAPAPHPGVPPPSQRREGAGARVPPGRGRRRPGRARPGVRPSTSASGERAPRRRGTPPPPARSHRGGCTSRRARPWPRRSRHTAPLARVRSPRLHRYRPPARGSGSASSSAAAPCR